MLRRSDARWTSIARRSILFLAAAFVLLPSSAHAQWSPIDDSEGLTACGTVDGTTGPYANWDVRNSGGYASVSLLEVGAWYSRWMVAANTALSTHGVYLQSGTDADFAAQTKLATATPEDVFGFRVNGPTDIVNVYIRNATNAGGTADSNLHFDDAWIDSSARDLSVPSAVPDPTGAPLLATGLSRFPIRRRR